MNIWRWRAPLAAAILVLCIWSPAGAAQSAAPSSTPTPNPAFRPYPNLDELGCYWAPNHDAADLCAQWQAARAAQESAGSAATANTIAAVALAISGAGMFALFWTLHQSNLSLSEARKAAAAAEAAVSETQRIGEAQVRCYLAVTSVKLEILASDKSPRLSFCVKNYGQSPAIDVTREVLIAYVHSEDRKTLRKSEAFFRGTVGTIIAPSSEYSLPRLLYEFPLSEPEIALLNSNLLAVTITVALKGFDVFGKPFDVEAKFVKLTATFDTESELAPLGHRISNRADV